MGEILRKYADVLRVGRIVLNGTIVQWDTNHASNIAQLRGFSTALISALSRRGDANSFDQSTLRDAVYCVCKAVSINYVLSDVLDLVSGRVGEPCTITTSRKDGTPL